MEKLDHSLERYFPTLKKIGVRNFFSFLVVALLATGVLLTINQVKQQQETRGSAATLDTTCPNATTVPVGALPQQPKPIWCYTNLTTNVPDTHTEGTNSWEDNFNSNVSFGEFKDSQGGYRVYERIGDFIGRSQHWRHNNHWMTDIYPYFIGDPASPNPKDWTFTGGAMMRPNRSFRFENGKLIIEADLAAGIQGYLDEDVWQEITITNAPNPTGDVRDNLYAYGQFGGFWSMGCRLAPSRGTTCAMYRPSGPAQDLTRCFATEAGREFEISHFQHCGSTQFGGVIGGAIDPTTGVMLENAWRACQPGQDDMFCRDRFRMELTKTGMVVYVNGIKFHEDSGWTGSKQLPDALVNSDIYIYFSDWVHSSGSVPPVRFHWGRLTVNPTNGPNAAPSFCLGQPQNTCPMNMSSTPMPTSLVSSSPTPTMAQHTTPTPTTQPTQPPLTGSASMSIQPATQSVPASSAFTVMVHENSGTTPVNATQAVITYPTALLRFDGFDTTTMQSAFPVMAQQTESGGTITIARGTTTPVSGNQHIVGLKFSVRATTASTAAITLTSSSVLLSSQTNTNILSQRNNATVNITVTKTGDLNNDNKIDILDLSIFLNKWNSTDSASDMNHDGTVNILDLSILLSQWGK